MAEHLHGYPRCETPAGQSCPASDVNYGECQKHGALTSCAPSVVDGIPTGQYHCVHRDAKSAVRPSPKAKARPAKKAAARARPKKAAKKAGRKPAKKAGKKPAKKAKTRKKAGKKKK